MKRLVVVFFLVCCLVVFFIPFVSGSYVCPAAITTENSGSAYYLDLLHPSAAASPHNSAFGMAFTANATVYLNDVQFFMNRISSALGTVTARLYAVQDGTAGTDAYPTNTPLANSSAVEVVTISGSRSWVLFAFDGSYQLVQGTSYVLTCEVSDATDFDNSPVAGVGFHRLASVDAGMNFVVFCNSNWYFGTYDLAFIVNGDSDPPSTPTPSPSPVGSAVPGYPPVDPFVAVPSYYMVLLVLFACVAVLAGLYVTFEREGENKGVALLFVLVGLVLFVILIVGYLVGF